MKNKPDVKQIIAFIDVLLGLHSDNLLLPEDKDQLLNGTLGMALNYLRLQCESVEAAPGKELSFEIGMGIVNTHGLMAEMINANRMATTAPAHMKKALLDSLNEAIGHGKYIVEQITGKSS